MQANRLFLITRYFFWFRRRRLCTGRLPGNSHLKPGEYKHETLDQSSDPRLYHVNHFLLLDTKWRQWCCTQTSWCYGSNTYRSVYRCVECVQFNIWLSFSADAAIRSLTEVFPALLLCFLIFTYIIWRDSPTFLFQEGKKQQFRFGGKLTLWQTGSSYWLPNTLKCTVAWLPLLSTIKVSVGFISKKNQCMHH